MTLTARARTRRAHIATRTGRRQLILGARATKWIIEADATNAVRNFTRPAEPKDAA